MSVLTKSELLDVINAVRTTYKYNIEDSSHGRGFLYGPPDNSVSPYTKRFYATFNDQEPRDAMKALLNNAPRLIQDHMRCRALLEAAETRLIVQEEALKEQKQLAALASDEAGSLKVDLDKANEEIEQLRAKLNKVEGLFEEGQAG